MADDRTPERRGRYKKFLRYSNPYKFSAARRRKTGKNNICKVGRSRCVFQNSLKKSESEIDVADVHVCEESSSLKSLQHKSSPERAHTMVSTSPGEFCDSDEMQDIDETFQYEFEETHDGRRVGGTVASWLARSTPERALRVRALAGDVVLCSWARHFTLTVPLSTQVYK